MASDFDNKPPQNQPAGAAGGDDFDEFDDFDDFDDFDEAAGLDAFDVDDDPFADDSESDPDAALDAAVDELDAMIAAEPVPATTTPTPQSVAPPSTMAEADEFEADEFEADEFGADDFDPDDDGGREVAADDFAAEGFEPEPIPAVLPAPAAAEAPKADGDGAGDEFEADEFEADEFEADEFDADDVTATAPEQPVSGTPAEKAVDEDDDFAEIAAAFKTPIDEFDEPASAPDDFADEPLAEDDFAAEEEATGPEVEAAPEVAETAPDAGGDLDAMLAARSTQRGGGAAAAAPPLPEEASDDDDDADHSGDGFDEAAVDAAFDETLAVPDDADAGFEEMPDPADEDAEELLPAGDAVTRLGDDMTVSSGESLAIDDDTGFAPDDEDAPADPVAETGLDEAAAAAAAATIADHAGREPPQATQQATQQARPKRRQRKKPRGPSVPLIDVGESGFDKVAEAYPKRLRAVHDLAARKMTPKGLEFAEKLCRKWAAKAQVPYRLELDAVAQALGGDPGSYVINLGFEMACTTAAADDPEGGRRLLHTMDWKLDGLGRMMVAARRHAPAGMWVNITWPGYLGCLQGVAPGRFAAAINHAPINGKGPPFVAWPMSKLRWYGQKGMPPALLLRKAFDECDDFYAAVELIERTPICYPAIFSVLGPQDGEFSIIERTETAKSTQKRAPAVTNHWLNKDFPGTVTAYQSNERLVAMKSRINQGVKNDEWLVHPVLNPETRLAVDLNPATGRMRIRGYQGVTPVTSLLDIYAD